MFGGDLTTLNNYTAAQFSPSAEPKGNRIPV